MICTHFACENAYCDGARMFKYLLLLAGFPFEVGIYGKSDVGSKILGPSSLAEASAECSFDLGVAIDVVSDELAWWVLPLNRFVAYRRLRLFDI